MSELVKIGAIAAGGDGVGRLADGRAVFVPRTVPGDEITVGGGREPGGGRRTESHRGRRGRLRLHKSFARGEVETIVSPGPNRVAPPCPHFTADQCGGCQLQQLAYDAQLDAKRTIVGEALRRIGKLDVPNPDIVEAIAEWRYGTKISLAVGRTGRGLGKMIGLHRYNRPGSVFPLLDCHITDFRLMELWKRLKPHLDLLPRDLSRLTLRLDREEQYHVIAEAAGAPWQTAEALRTALSSPDGPSVICWWQPTDGAARVIAGPRTGFPPTAFEQGNAEMGMVARRWAVDRLQVSGGGVAWDLYGGIGDTATLLAQRGAQVVSVDADESAIAWARTRGVDAIRFIAGRTEDVLPSLPDPDFVVVNPPRPGLHWNVTLRLREHPVIRLAYISRDPATLARDLERLSVNYRLLETRAFDLFPQTAQVEAVAILEAA